MDRPSADRRRSMCTLDTEMSTEVHQRTLEKSVDIWMTEGVSMLPPPSVTAQGLRLNMRSGSGDK